jgi:hypothetical protein
LPDHAMGLQMTDRSRICGCRFTQASRWLFVQSAWPYSWRRDTGGAPGDARRQSWTSSGCPHGWWRRRSRSGKRSRGNCTIRLGRR